VAHQQIGPGVKLKLENRLHAMACDGQVWLRDAPDDFATVWVPLLSAPISQTDRSAAA
jgi:hypothetical protein